MQRQDHQSPEPSLTFSVKRVGMVTSCGLIVLSLLFGALASVEPPEAGVSEKGIALYLGGLNALSVGEVSRGRILLEGACQAGHEPSCQEVWLRVDMEVAQLSAREALELTAQQVAEGTEGIYFLYEDVVEDSVTARVYCPVTQHEQLSDMLREFSGKLGG